MYVSSPRFRDFVAIFLAVQKNPPGLTCFYWPKLYVCQFLVLKAFECLILGDDKIPKHLRNNIAVRLFTLSFLFNLPGTVKI